MNAKRAIVSDLVNDARCALRYSFEFRNDGNDEKAEFELAYRHACLQQLRKIIASRHNLKLDRYGWPIGV
jgi:hypothetical protein